MKTKYFTAKVRSMGNTIAVSIPITIRESMGIKEGDICDFTISLNVDKEE